MVDCFEFVCLWLLLVLFDVLLLWGLVFDGNALAFSLFVSCCGVDSVWVGDLLFALRLVVGLGCTCCFWVSSLLGLL